MTIGNNQNNIVMSKKVYRELILWLFLIIPYVYLFKIWNQLPDIVPTHFNLAGEADGWSSKQFLIFLPGSLGVGIYFLMLVLPQIDPKHNLSLEDNKYYAIRFMMAVFFSILCTYILHTSLSGKISNPSLLFGFIGGLFAVLGNYFKDMKPNYYIGIRTPWTLEDERVWYNTHRFGSKVWIFGGITLLFSSILIKNKDIFFPFFIISTLLITFIPIIYSYIDYKRGK
ncbi:MAG: hypothetical protein RL284_2206 [Bacteroidota bacterium]